MDMLDKKIIEQLDENCRHSHALIARKVRSSKAVVGYRIRRLEKQGVIKKYVLSINLGRIGFNTYKLYFKLWNYDESAKAQLMNFLLKNQSIIHVIKTEGTFDFSIVVATKSVAELDNIISELKNKFSKIIREYRLSIIVTSKIFGRTKLLQGKTDLSSRIETYSGVCTFFELDEKDKKILRSLSENSSISILAVANETRLSVDIIKYRLKKLLREGIINNFRLMLDVNKMGFTHQVFLLNVKKATKADEQKLISWAQMSKNVIYITKRVGFWDYEIHVALRNADEYAEFISKFEKEFSDIIGSYESIIQRETLKLTYFPY